MQRLLLTGLALLALASPGTARQGAAPEPLALTDAKVVDVRTGRVAAGATIVLRDGRIESVGSGPAPGGVRVVPVAGRFVVPGLVDAHTHLATLRAAQTALESGVTTIRSSGVSAYVDVGLRELVRSGALPGPDVLASGYHVRPRLAEEAFLTDPGLAPLLRRGVRTPADLRQVVQTNLAHKVDWIKVLATERAGTPDTDPRRQVYGEAELRAVVEAAGGTPVQAHAHGDEGAQAAVRAGVRSIEHGTYLSETTLSLMKARGVFLVPTYTTVLDLLEPGGDYDQPALRLRGRHMASRLRETVQRAHRMGVKIVTGADTGYGPNSLTRISHEIVAFVEIGLTPLEALQAATTTAAELLRLEGRIGQVAPGFEADLIVVERNPLEDPRTLEDVLMVISNGRVALDRLGVPAAAPTAAEARP
ncbi:MAG TPA: amidohydrolase family protein [Vicinamibacterales bacterium]|nr:amidohydrolase family protein [Vicinamibacterales bacterium]